MELLNSLLFMVNEMSPYVLLGFLIAGVLHAFIPQTVMARHLSGTGWRSVVKAAMIGIPLPLCSCGVLPTAVAMRRNGASKAASTSFLIATPQTGVDSIAATWSLLGPAFAVVRPVAALVTALFGGVAVGKTESPQAVAPQCATSDCEADRSRSFVGKCVDALRYGFIDLVGSIGGWLVIGLIVAAVITVYVPDDFFAAFSDKPILSMILVLIVAIPMYVCATGSIPIALSLVMKGLSPGTALVLLMAGPAANFASVALIGKEMGRKSASIYLASIIVGAMAFGLAIDYLMPTAWFDIRGISSAVCHHGHVVEVFPTICSAVLASLLIVTFVKRFKHKNIKTTAMTREYIIQGMNCPHCQAAVTKAISSVKGVTQVDVNLSTGKAVVEGEHDGADVVSAVRGAGFDVKL